MKCIYCNHEKLYQLNTGQFKCAKCKRKFSNKKLKIKQNIIECFCNDLTINQTRDKLSINYTTVQKYYTIIREDIVNYLEHKYDQNKIIAYDEYIYIEKSKRKKKSNIFEAENFITFEYDNKIYNLLLPSFQRYKNIYQDEIPEDIYQKEFSKFIRYNKITNLKKQQNLIEQFWNYFEDQICKYRGIKKSNFVYYLKEIEFKFNYTIDNRIKILLEII
jgi:transposase-like protein